jgi:hypothetical protein
MCGNRDHNPITVSDIEIMPVTRHRHGQSTGQSGTVGYDQQFKVKKYVPDIIKTFQISLSAGHSTNSFTTAFKSRGSTQVNTLFSAHYWVPA